MATFRRRGTKWQAQIRLHGHPAMSRTFTTKRDAEVWARQIEASIERGDLPGSLVALKNVTLLQMLERYEATVTPLKKGEASERYRLRVLRNHPIARLSLDKLTPAMVTIYRDDRLRSVSAVFGPARTRHTATLSGGREERMGRGAPTKPCIEDQEARSRQGEGTQGHRRRVGAASNRSRQVPQWSPLQHHHVRDPYRDAEGRNPVDSLERYKLRREHRPFGRHQERRGQNRSVKLIGASALPTTDNHAAGERVFPLSPNAVRLAWERLKRRAGINDLHFHDLRHEAISRFFELGLSIPEVALISGHRDFKMLFRYTHLRPADVAKKLG